MTDADIEDTDGAQPELDHEAIERDIAAGAKAFSELLKNAALDWNHWSATILGLRGLRALAFERARTTDMKRQAYRDTMTGLLSLRKYAVYDQIDKQTRSDCYRLMDRLEEIDAWYGSKLTTTEKLKWKHPGTIVKHCPKHLLSGGMRRHNQPAHKAVRRSAAALEVENARLRKLLIQLIQRFAKLDPTVLDLLAQVEPPDEPNDSIEEAFDD